ncbi:MAG: hypothetical protein FJZ66_03170 [Bacteroidetes bacterium]|nr:hypothetical protein [Bacteroidota bacterium]
MKSLILTSFLAFFYFLNSFSQKVEKENLGQKVRIYWDSGNKKLQATGSYYVNEEKFILNKTEKHGKWSFYSFEGKLEEDRMYYRNRIHGKQLTYHPNGNIKTLVYFTFNVPDSIFKEYDESGKLLISGNYELGSPEGKWEYFYSDGRQKSIESVENDTTYLMQHWEADSLHKQTVIDGKGYLNSYYSSGRAKEKYTYTRGLKTGDFEERTANGLISVKGVFNLGKKEGDWFFYSSEGKLEKHMQFKNDSLDGIYEVFYNDTLLNTKGQYLMGLKIGDWYWNFPDGKPEITGAFDADKQHKNWVYYFPNGGISYEATFDKGKKTGKWHYFYENGQNYRIGNYVDDLKEGNWKTWYEDGTLLMEGDYKYGQEIGQWKNYWESGVVKNITTFEAGKLNGPWVSNNPNNIQTVQGWYKDGLRVKEWKEYYDNGRLMQISNYKIIKRKNYSKGIAVLGMREKLSELHGTFLAYSQLDYTVKAKGKYKNGLKHGVWIDYYPGGIIPTVISSYKKGKLHGTMKQFGKRGNLHFETNYKNGLKHGWLIIYDNRGKESVRKLFKKGIELTPKNEGDIFTP